MKYSKKMYLNVTVSGTNPNYTSLGLKLLDEMPGTNNSNQCASVRIRYDMIRYDTSHLCQTPYNIK